MPSQERDGPTYHKVYLQHFILQISNPTIFSKWATNNAAL
jgi:hypothetical protein